MYNYPNLPILRRTVNMTQTQVADYIKMQQSDYNRIEKGKKKLDLKYAKKLATLYKVSLDIITSADSMESIDNFPAHNMSNADMQKELASIFKTLEEIMDCLRLIIQLITKAAVSS